MLLGSTLIQDLRALDSFDLEKWCAFLDNKVNIAQLSNAQWYVLVYNAKEEMLRHQERGPWVVIYERCCTLAYRGFVSAEALFDNSHANAKITRKALSRAVLAISRFCVHDNFESLFQKIIAAKRPLYWIALFNNPELVAALFQPRNIAQRQIPLITLFDTLGNFLNSDSNQRLMLILANFALQHGILNLHRFYNPDLLIAVPGLRQIVFSEPFLLKSNVQHIAVAVFQFEEDFPRVYQHFKDQLAKVQGNNASLTRLHASRCFSFISHLADHPQLKIIMQQDANLRLLVVTSLDHVGNTVQALGIVDIFPEMIHVLLDNLESRLWQPSHPTIHRRTQSMLYALRGSQVYRNAIPNPATACAAAIPVLPRRDTLQNQTAPDIAILCKYIDACSVSDGEKAAIFDSKANESSPALLSAFEQSVNCQNQAEFTDMTNDLEQMRQACRSANL